MDYEKIPLSEQLHRAASNFAIHPEYPVCVIREWAEMPVSAYLGGNSEAGLERREQFRRLMGLPPEKVKTMTYREAVKRLAYFLRQTPSDSCLERALILLAEPLSETWKSYKEALDAKNKT